MATKRKRKSRDEVAPKATDIVSKAKDDVAPTRSEIEVGHRVRHPQHGEGVVTGVNKVKDVGTLIAINDRNDWLPADGFVRVDD